jgi:NADP-dependent 3-hydroxy acid dehydrogenase YdfG
MPQPISHKAWFITGASKGFGYVWTEAALARGDSVAAAARNVGMLDTLKVKYGNRLLPLKLDVGNKSAVEAAVKQVHKQLGRIDVAINNAGYGLFGAIEEVSEQEARAQIETNLFGALWVTQAVLPIMRAQLSGHIIQISSIGGVWTVPTSGLYHASKWGLEGFSQALAAEVKPVRHKSHDHRARRFRHRIWHHICASRAARQLLQADGWTRSGRLRIHR